MKYWFHSFDEASESYIETLSNETDITDAESYYDAVYDNYMDQLDSLNYAMDSLVVQAPAVQRILTESPTQQIHHVVSKELIPPPAQMTVPQQIVIYHSLTCTLMSSCNHKPPYQPLRRSSSQT